MIKDALQTIVKQPLLHFLVAGAIIFVAYGWQDREIVTDDSTLQIIVDRDALLNYMQYQSQAFNRELFSQQFDELTENERQTLIRQYVRQEELYREAISLGLDRGDYDIRLRLVQKVNFLLEDIAAGQAAQVEPSEEDLQQYYAQHADAYRIDPVYSFSHIFFDNELHGDAQAKLLAENLLHTLQRGSVDADDSGKFGDRFRYLRNYVARSQDQVRNNFAADFVAELDRLDTVAPAWAGPIASRYGWHLVLLRERTAPRLPALPEVRDQVLDDYRYAALTDALQEVENELLEKYEVVVEIP